MAIILHPAPLWQSPRSEFVTLWHGCTEVDRQLIEENGIDLDQCSYQNDFGRGFYTTTLRNQAEQWAHYRYIRWTRRNKNANMPVVLQFKVQRASHGSTMGLDRLNSLHFVRGDYMDEDYWSLVQHCRQSPPAPALHDHRHSNGGWYDVVSGPVAAMWQQRVAMSNCDQISFHTIQGVELLQHLIGLGNPHYQSFGVL